MASEGDGRILGYPPTSNRADPVPLCSLRIGPCSPGGPIPGPEQGTKGTRENRPSSGVCHLRPARLASGLLGTPPEVVNSRNHLAQAAYFDSREA